MNNNVRKICWKKYKKQVCEFTSKYQIELITLFELFLFICNLYKECTLKDEKLYYIFTIFNGLLFLLWIFILYQYKGKKRNKKNDSYTIAYLLLSFFYILIVSFISFKNQKKLLIFINMDSCIRDCNQISNKIFFSFIFLLIGAFFVEWIVYFAVLKSVKNIIESVDKTEFNIILLKSTLQSLTTSIAFMGLTGWGLENNQILLILNIDAFAAFSYPILDINKYVRQKEIEQNEIDKHNTTVKPNVKSNN